MAKRVLIVDDDYFFRSVLKKTIEGLGYETAEAEDGLFAQQMIGLEHFDVVVSDISMPRFTGLQLLKWTTEVKAVPVILMTGFMDLVETKQAASQGAAGFLSKPFKREDVEALLKQCVRPDPKVETPQNLDDHYSKISIDDFTTGSDIKFDIFIRITAEKYVLIAHSGQNITSERVKSYKSKGIGYLYMNKEDFKRYVEFSSGLLRRVAESKKVDPVKKMNFLKHTSEIITKQIYHEDLDRDSYLHARNIVENASAILSDSADCLSLLDVLSQHSDHVYIHSVAVSFYSSYIAKAIGWRSTQALTKLSMGALFHDIGKKEIPREILDKPRREQTAEEIQLIETHPGRGIDLLSGVREIPSDVVMIVHQHHEACLGTGFPAHLKKDRIHPMARLVAVANEFCRLALPGPEGPGLAPHDAIRRMMVYEVDNLDPDMFFGLMKALKFSPPKDFLSKYQKNREVA